MDGYLIHTFTQGVTGKSMDVFGLDQKPALFRFHFIKVNKNNACAKPSDLGSSFRYSLSENRKFPSRVWLELFCTEKNERATEVSESAFDVAQFVTEQWKIFHRVCFRTAIETLLDLTHSICPLNPKEEWWNLVLEESVARVRDYFVCYKQHSIGKVFDS